MKFDIWYEAVVFTRLDKLYHNYNYFFTWLFTAFETELSQSNLTPLRSSFPNTKSLKLLEKTMWPIFTMGFTIHNQVTGSQMYSQNLPYSKGIGSPAVAIPVLKVL